MRFKLLVIIFIGFLSTYAGEIKAEEICLYSTPTQYDKCLKKGKSNLIPKYPLDSAHIGLTFEKNWLSLGKNPFNWNSEYTILRFRTNDGNKIKVTKSINKNSSWNYKNNPKSFFIKGEDIISWRFNHLETLSFLGFKREIHTFDINYINESGKQETLSGRSDMPHRRFGFVKDIFEKASGMKSNQEKDISEMLIKKLKKYEKRVAIIQSIIKIPEYKNKGCFNIYETKFPDLEIEYRKLSKTINPLRAKLDLPPSTDLKPICKK